jgi:hypothetical protein
MDTGYIGKMSLAERFWAKVDKDGPVHSVLGTPCWLWTGARDSAGYGNLKLRSFVTDKAHRVSWALNFGPIPDDAFVLHRCDNPPCVNPGHLYLGGHLENMADMVERDRATRYRAAWTHCPEGHEFTPENTRIVSTTGKRLCRICVRRRGREQDKKRRKK